MIIRHIDYPEVKYDLVHMFLADSEIWQYRHAAIDSRDGWQEGRQGTGYFKLDIKGSGADCCVSRMIKLMAADRDVSRNIELNNQYDAWLLFYPSGVDVPYHKDPAPEGFKHKRMNVMLTRPREGGQLFFRTENEVGHVSDSIDLEEGDGIIFYPSEIEHCVSFCAGNRLVLSVGILEPK